jgi:hypothetical protein
MIAASAEALADRSVIAMTPQSRSKVHDERFGRFTSADNLDSPGSDL